MNSAGWDSLSSWFNAWLAAEAAERPRLRAQLAAEHPELVADADVLTAASGHLSGFLETPALMLAARDLAEDDPLLSTDSMIGPYRLLKLLARGGTGDVYRATDVRLQRDVAVKVLAQSRTGDPQRVERFMHEARMTASLDHTNIVRVYDVGRVDDRAYLVAELLEGETLRARIARGPLPVDEALQIGINVSRGLAAAHAAGLVHRDLKPDNIFLTRSGETKILDFGIAKLAQNEPDRDGFATMTGVVLGTAGYLAPEQIRGEPIDARADLFALGAVLFEMLTGTRAFARAHLVETLHAILHDTPSTALAERVDVPVGLLELVMRLLEKSPDARVQSAADLIAALERVRTVSRDRPYARLLGRWRHMRRTRPIPVPRGRIAIAMAIVSVAIAAAAIAWYRRPPAPVTLAVMPFERIPPSADGALETGLADQIVSRLGQMPNVRVLPMTATRRLSREDPVNAARQLGATLVLTMRIQQDRDEIRATPQLLSANDGQVIWTTMATSDASRTFFIQDAIVKLVMEQLAPRLPASASARITAVGTRNNEAYQAYVRGRAIVLDPTPPNLKQAAALFQRAVDLDPQFADAWAGLGSAYRRMPQVSGAPPADAFPLAKQAAERALQLQAEHAEAHSVLGTVAFSYEWDYGESERRLRHALQLQPSSADTQLFLAHLYSAMGRHDEALEEIRRARALDLAWPLPRAIEGQVLNKAGEYDRALRLLNELLEIEPDLWMAHVWRLQALTGLGRYEEVVQRADDALEVRRRIQKSDRPFPILVAEKGYALARLGRSDEARAALEVLRRESLDTYVSPYHEANVLVGLGQTEEAMTRLEAAIARRDFMLTVLGVARTWDDLRDHPRFREILKQVHLLEVSDRRRRR